MKLLKGDINDYYPAEEFDVILTDPPYAIKKAKWDELTLKEYRNLVLDNLERLFRENTAEDGVLFMFVSQTIDWYVIKFWLDKGYVLMNSIIWHYKNGHRKSKFMFPMSNEVIIMIGKRKKTQFNCPRDPNNVQKGSRKRRNYRKDGSYTTTISMPHPDGIKYTAVYIEPRINGMDPVRTPHPTQKPERIINILLSGFKKGIKVLDPFMGSGTTGVVAIKKGMFFVGVEIDDDYYLIAKNRINEI